MTKRRPARAAVTGELAEERRPGNPLGGWRNVLPLVNTAWRHLLFLNYEVPAEILRPRLPSGTELDLQDGRALVRVVGFRFLGTRLMKLPVPWHRDFDEVNLRFYARRRVEGAWRTGVVFVRELVPTPLFAWLARHVVHEHYLTLPMRHAPEVDQPPKHAPAQVRYEWQHAKRWQGMAGTPVGEARRPEDGSEEAFLTVRHWAWTARRSGSTLEHEVIHPRWKVWRIADARLDTDVATLFGPEFAEALSGPPTSALLADGSKVAVSPSAWLTGAAREPVRQGARRRPVPG